MKLCDEAVASVPFRTAPGRRERWKGSMIGTMRTRLRDEYPVMGIELSRVPLRLGRISSTAAVGV